MGHTTGSIAVGGTGGGAGQADRQRQHWSGGEGRSAPREGCSDCDTDKRPTRWAQAGVGERRERRDRQATLRRGGHKAAGVWRLGRRRARRQRAPSGSTVHAPGRRGRHGFGRPTPRPPRLWPGDWRLAAASRGGRVECARARNIPVAVPVNGRNSRSYRERLIGSIYLNNTLVKARQSCFVINLTRHAIGGGGSPRNTRDANGDGGSLVRPLSNVGVHPATSAPTSKRNGHHSLWSTQPLPPPPPLTTAAPIGTICPQSALAHHRP